MLKLFLVFVQIAEIVDLIPLEGRNQGALVLLKDYLGEELAQAPDVDQIDHVHLPGQVLRGLGMAL